MARNPQTQAAPTETIPEPGSQPAMDLPEAEEPKSLEERKVLALEEIAMALRDVSVRSALASAAAVKPAAKGPAAITLPMGVGIKRCPRGHGMQATDKYCQHCYREDNPRRGGRGAVFTPPAAADVDVG